MTTRPQTPSRAATRPSTARPCYMCEGDYGVNAKGECNLCGYGAHKNKRRTGTPGTRKRERKRLKTADKKLDRVKNAEKKSGLDMGIPRPSVGCEPLFERLSGQDEIWNFLVAQGVLIQPSDLRTPPGRFDEDVLAEHGMCPDLLFSPYPFEDGMVSPLDICIVDDIASYFSPHHFEDGMVSPLGIP